MNQAFAIAPAPRSQPSRLGAWGSWGASEEEASSQLDLASLVPLVADVVSSAQDPYQQAAVWRQRAAWYRSIGFEQRAKVLEAKAEAAERRFALELEAEQSTREWRGLGKTGLIVGIGVGVSLIVLLLAAAVRTTRPSRAPRKRKPRLRIAGS